MSLALKKERSEIDGRAGDIFDHTAFNDMGSEVQIVNTRASKTNHKSLYHIISGAGREGNRDPINEHGVTLLQYSTLLYFTLVLY